MRSGIRHRKFSNRIPMGHCPKHGAYPLNFTYAGMQFANACPQCYPHWKEQLKAARRAELNERAEGNN